MSAARGPPRLSRAPIDTPLRSRVVPRSLPSIRVTPKNFANVQSAREHVAYDLATDIVGLLQSDARIESRGDNGSVIGHEQVGPAGIAVLVRKNDHPRTVKTALEAVGSPAVVNGAGSVFATEQAREWLRLLEAPERPEMLARARTAALTASFGTATCVQLVPPFMETVATLPLAPPFE